MHWIASVFIALPVAAALARRFDRPLPQLELATAVIVVIALAWGVASEPDMFLGAAAMGAAVLLLFIVAVSVGAALEALPSAVRRALGRDRRRTVPIPAARPSRQAVGASHASS